MNVATPAIQNLARRLIAFEAARDAANEPADAVVRVCEKLRTSLAKLTGVAGFRSLMARAKALATAQVPWLDSVQVRADGSLEGFDAARRQQVTSPSDEAGAAIVAQLLGLLVTFIGEPLALRLVRDAWPDASLIGIDAGNGDGL